MQLNIPQCAYCQGGQIMQAIALAEGRGERFLIIEV